MDASYRAQQSADRIGQPGKTGTMTRRVAILQSNYIPWKGYFDIINLVDEFVLYDEVQYTRRDWRNRNQIKTPGGLLWLTIPVRVKGKYTQRIMDTVVSEPDWPQRHWASITHNYARAGGFAEYRGVLSDLYGSVHETLLSQINHRFLTTLCQLLGIRTRLSWSTDYPRQTEDRTRRLVEICRQLGATEYLSGPAARSYLDESAFAAAGIRVQYMNYDGYAEYEQVHPPFCHAVSIIDLLLNTGAAARRYMKS